jgi:predicted GTPase
MITESIREFQKNAPRHLSGDEVVVIEDAKSHTKRGVYIPYSLYRLFEKELNESIRKEMAESFTESFDGVGRVHES